MTSAEYERLKQFANSLSCDEAKQEMRELLLDMYHPPKLPALFKAPVFNPTKEI
jgi:hypothetical protein